MKTNAATNTFKSNRRSKRNLNTKLTLHSVHINL